MEKSTLEKLNAEAVRQGDSYSRHVIDRPESFFGNAYWDFTRRERARWTVEAAKKVLTVSRPHDVLEVGCGIGFTTLETVKMAGDWLGKLTALDASDRAISLARDLLAKESAQTQKKITFAHEDFFKHTGGPYDLVYMHEVFEHIPVFDAIFHQAAALLRPNGAFMVSTPNGLRVLNRFLKLGGKPMHIMDPTHHHEYTVEELKQPPPGWTVTAITGRQLVDSYALQRLAGLGKGPLMKLVERPSKWITDNRWMYNAGQRFPSMSTELLVLYQHTES